MVASFVVGESARQFAVRHPIGKWGVPMAQRRWSGLFALTVSLLSACAAELTDSIEDLEADVGGLDGIADMFRGQTESEIRTRLTDYGIGYVVSALSLETCPRHFEASFRNAWHNMTGELYYMTVLGALAARTRISRSLRPRVARSLVRSYRDGWMMAV